MENKYYTPSIEEFFVGFECEWQSKIRRESWNKQICDVDLINIAYDSFEHSDIEEPFNEQFRVKYLDSSDIEELGFKLAFSDIGIECWKLGNFELRTDVDLGAYIDSGNLYSIFYNPYGKQYNCVFSGIIKNKSELKKVLNMLNIK